MFDLFMKKWLFDSGVSRQTAEWELTGPTTGETSTLQIFSAMSLSPAYHTALKDPLQEKTMEMIGTGWPSLQRKISAWPSDHQDMKKELLTFPVLTSLTLLVRR